MTETCGRYSEKQISRFIDGELSRQEIRQIRQHLDTCSACRHLAAQFQRITRTFDELTEPTGWGIDAERLYQALEKRVEKPARPRKLRFFSHPVRPLLALASIAALLVIGVFALKNDGMSPNGPSAIVTSIDTEYTAVMILETPDTHHTIIWYSDT